jgi:hypothetical protein
MVYSIKVIKWLNTRSVYLNVNLLTYIINYTMIKISSILWLLKLWNLEI